MTSPQSGELDGREQPQGLPLLTSKSELRILRLLRVHGYPVAVGAGYIA